MQVVLGASIVAANHFATIFDRRLDLTTTGLIVQIRKKRLRKDCCFVFPYCNYNEIN